MSWNFRRRIKIAPGVHINLSKKGISTSIGPRGASLTFGPNGTYLNTSIPGTGLYKRRKLSSLSSPSSYNTHTNPINSPNTSSTMPAGCAFALILFTIFNIVFIIGWLGDTYFINNMENPFAVYFLGNIGLIFLGVIVELMRQSDDKKESTFSYNQEKDNAQSALEKLSTNEKVASDILKTYIQCLNLNEEHDKEMMILEEMKASKKQKVLNLIPVQEAKVEALKETLKKIQYDADAGLSEEQKQAFQDLSDAFENLSNSDKILFETGVTSTNSITKEDTDFEFGIFNYIKSEFDIPVMKIPKSSTKFYIYPRFIIRSESSTNFIVYPIDDINIEFDVVHIQEAIGSRNAGPKDAKVIESNYLYETKSGGPDRRYSYNPLYITYEFGRLMIPKFSFTRSMTYYISNKDAAEEMQKAFNQYVRLLKTDIKRETTTADEHLNNESCTAEPTVEKWDIDLSKIERPDPLLEDVIKYVVSEQVGSIAEIQRKFEIGPNRTIKICEQLETLGILGPNRGVQGYEVLIKNIKELQKSSTEATTTQNTKPTRIRTKSNSRELDALVGLTSVKEEIRTLSNFIQIQQKREEQGLKASSVSYHCVFTGNPGTGKTTVARIVAKIYKKLGILSKGHLVETDRAGLVAEYVGQTAVKTNKIIDSALDGVLFIDEAYSLIGTGQDYGKEAIATLLKRMEDDRDRLVVILAGYSKEMQDFINTNPGLQSRFNRYIEFPDYSAEELLQIFEMNVQKFDYKLEKEAAVAMAEYFQNAVNNKDANFGNARFVRNIFEKTLEKQANRLSTDPDLDKDELTLITKEDLPILECK